ncbi:hypothetical protein LSH36_376g04026 [Paralvinella palmiformis]|uniref:Transcription initiation factor TFIID subunit 1 n=1 Tax=Paralvinella palmiformis TaxID=53620 RepID=A0AAD9JEE3_9ANNE|nr:hypothetical protein LSH36_376g04026 [Paralvinella palmiformis]
MDSEEEHEGGNDGLEESNEAKTEGGSVNLTGFLFGNIDEKGKLENDILDEDSKKHLDGLSLLGVGSLVEEITTDVDRSQEDTTSTGDSEKADNAVDYSDITELADDEEEKYKAALSTMVPPSKGDDNYDEDDTKLMPPPNWIPGHSLEPNQSNQSSPEKSEQGSPDSKKNLSPGSAAKLKTPLAGMLPPELADKDVTELFPEFKQGQVLRFSRLFRPVHVPHIWKKKKKKRVDSSDKEPSKIEKSKDRTGDTDKQKSKEESGVEIKREVQDSCDPADLSQDQTYMTKKEGNDESCKPSVDFMDGGSVNGTDTKSEEEDYWPYKLNLGRDPKSEECMIDDAILMLQSEENTQKAQNMDVDKDVKSEVADWRYGPAVLWYDMLNVDETGEGFSYGFKLKGEKKESDNEDGDQSDVKTDISKMPVWQSIEFPDDAFHMVTQVQWEDDVIWNSEEVRQKILQNHKQKAAAAGWIPTSASRTAAQYFQQLSGKAPPLSSLTGGFKSMSTDNDGEHTRDVWYSIFPVENEDLVYGRWEDDVIWDHENMEKIPEPPVLTLDPNDENIILNIPEDREPSSESESQNASKKEKEIRKSKILLGKAGILKEDDDEVEEENDELIKKDPFNISNDEYYNPKLTTDNALTRSLGGTLIQHSNPAAELRQPFFPTHLGLLKLRNFHRPPLKKYSYGPMASPGPHPVLPLLKNIRRKAKIREQERLASGGGDMFFMRSAEDLTGKDGELILAEFSEEFPPLMNQVGMASKMKNYYKRKPGKDANPPKFEYGELAYAHTSPFLGSLAPGQCLQAFENNMYRVPIFEHKVPDTDFLIIRNRQQEAEKIYSVAQECPLQDVPGPNSKKANNFIRDFLQVFIYRLFLKSKDEPKRIKMEEIKKAFPSHSESSIRKRLKLCADFKRTGMDSNWWVLKSDFRLPSEEEIRAMVSPEQCCGYYSMIAAEQRLKDAGYGEKFFFAQDDDNEEELQVKMDDEVRAAPWNTTRAYIDAMKGKCLLSLTGFADPTGCGEGFAYMKVPNKPAQTKDDQNKETPQKKTVTGTDADLRRLSLKDAKQLLKKFGVPEAEIKKLSRWEVIDVVRTMSTEQAKSGQEAGMSKFARGNRFSTAEHQERYKEECQRIFDLQNRVLASTEVLSTDEGSTSCDDSDFEEMGKNIENMLSNKKSSAQINLEREEEERRELQKMLRGEDFGKDKKKDKKDSDSPKGSSGMRKLKITRTFCDESGKEFTRTEIVRKQAVIDTYVRIRQSKDSQFIRQFATLDEAQKEEMKKERRRIQEQLRRIKRNQAKGTIMKHPQATPPKKKKKDKQPIKTNLKCGACGAVGHMRTNKECPMYNKLTPQPSYPVAITQEEEESLEKANLVDQDLINVDGTKVTISKNLVQHVDAVKRKSLVLKFPKMVAEKQKRRRVGTVVHCDYLKKPKKSSNRRRTDPVVTLSTIFENILNEMREIPNAIPFLTPVNPKQVPDYHRIVTKPMDLQTIREGLRNRKYLSRESFLLDVSQIVKNSEIVDNGDSLCEPQIVDGDGSLCEPRVVGSDGSLCAPRVVNTDGSLYEPQVVDDDGSLCEPQIVNSGGSLYEPQVVGGGGSLFETQVVDHCAKSVLTITAQKMLDVSLQRIAEKEEKLMRLEKAINPLLDDNDQVALSYILATVTEDRLKVLDNSHPFHNPVNKKFVKDYYDVIKQPMDLSTLLKNVNTHKYKNREQYLEDLSLIYKNSEKYNGPESTYTATAKKLIEVAKQAFSEQEEMLTQLEEAIRETEEAALDAADTDSIMTGTSFTGNQDGDLESVDSLGMSKDVTVQEDTNDNSMRPSNMTDNDQSTSFMMQNISRDEEFVDVEGEDYYENSYVNQEKTEDSNDLDLAEDLRITPENSEDEDPSSVKLSSNDSDSDKEDNEDQSSYQAEMNKSQAYTYDENAQDYMYTESEAQAIAQMDTQQFNDEDSFDPGQFFTSFPQQYQDNGTCENNNQPDANTSNINQDLQVSESDSDSDDGGFVPVVDEQL